MVFVVVYAGAVTMLLVDELLESLKSAFIKLYKEGIVSNRAFYSDVIE